MTLWFTSDLHLGHVRAPELCHRPYGSSPDEITRMNQDLIEWHNEVVKPNDYVYYLGDMCLGQIHNSLPLLSQLNGWKTLILGNHDRPSAMYHHKDPSQREHFAELYSQYFDSIQTDGDIDLGGYSVKLHHMPYLNTYVDTTHEGWLRPEHYPVDDGRWLIHGHVHGLWRQKGRQINVGVDAWGYRPVSADTLIQMIQDGEKCS